MSEPTFNTFQGSYFFLSSPTGYPATNSNEINLDAGSGELDYVPDVAALGPDDGADGVVGNVDVRRLLVEHKRQALSARAFQQDLSSCFEQR